MSKKTAGKLTIACLLFFIISFMGWCFEKIGRYFLYNSTSDRGFLSMPICPIYGFSALLIYLFLGSPYSPRIGVIKRHTGRLLRSVSFIVNILLYFLFSVAISTAAELATGVFFSEALGVTLWNYESQPYSLGGYICLGYSLLWGVLITAFMLTLWQPLAKWVSRIGKGRAAAVSAILCGLSVADLAFNLIYLLKTGSHFNFL